MGEAEADSVFEPESERSIGADMCEPNKADGQHGRPGKLKGRDFKRDRSERCVSRVVDVGADPRAHEIADNAEVRHQDEGCKQPTTEND
jgi:hypothetical protein